MTNSETVEETREQGTGTTTEGNQVEEKDERRKTWLTFDKCITDFRAALEIAGEEGEFRDIIEYHGYTQPRRQEGLTMVTDTAAADQTKKDKKAEYHETSREAKGLRKKAQKTLSKCVASARLAFKNDPEILEILGLTGKRDQTFGGWAAFGTRFFEKSLALPEIQTGLAKYDVPLELLQTGSQEMIDAVEADKRKRSKKADAEDATAYKNKLYRKLWRWMKDFYRVVEIAFREKPQLKEKVGIVVPYLYLD